jgi:arylsulfatase
MFTTPAAAAGIPDVARNVIKEKHQYIDGVNNLDYWTGKSKESARNEFLYYRESNLMAVRLGP